MLITMCSAFTKAWAIDKHSQLFSYTCSICSLKIGNILFIIITLLPISLSLSLSCLSPHLYLFVSLSMCVCLFLFFSIISLSHAIIWEMACISLVSTIVLNFSRVFFLFVVHWTEARDTAFKPWSGYPFQLFIFNLSMYVFAHPHCPLLKPK